jgi:penicillin amidase
VKVVRVILKILAILLIVVIVLGLIAGAVGYAFTQRTLPQVNGQLAVAGLKDKVEVIRDKWGVPHIYAQNVEDLFFAQGYVHAQDRLWQMEFNRRVGSGTLSEIFGDVTLSDDTFLRTLGLRRVAEAEVAAFDPETKLIMESYARGVNAFIDTHQGNLPIEFTILGFKPAPWTPADSLAWGKVMALSLGGNYESELIRAKMIEKIGADKTKQLLPLYPADHPVIVPAGVSYQDLDVAPLLAQWQGIEELLGLGQGLGSNDWVVDGSKTVSGKPLLANDPHLGIQMPSIWYENHLSGGGFNVTGASFPGVPGVIIGHNERIAWGVTNVGPDVQDLYIEKINPANAGQYEFQGKWEDMQVVKEEIRIKGSESKTIEVRTTRHGPVMTPVLKGVTQTLALRWTALEPNKLFRSVLLLDRAKDWTSFREALSYWAVPSQNFVYADVDGNIGYQTPGWIPIRAQGDGLVPVPGTGEYEWQGYIPFDELPRVYNPAQHYVVTANNRVIGDQYPYSISYEWDIGYRAQRITDLLNAKPQLSAQDIRDIQADVYSFFAQEMLPQVTRLSPSDAQLKKAIDYLKGWDLRLTTDSVPAVIFEVFQNKLTSNTFADEIGDEALNKAYLSTQMPLAVLRQIRDTPDSPWWDNVTTPQKETENDILLLSLQQAVEELTKRFGSDMAKWQWGKLHTATFKHELGVEKPLPLYLIFNKGPFATAGDDNSVANGGYNEQYAQTTVPSYRQIVDLSDFGKSLSQHTTGESGNPFSKHYADFIKPWIQVQHHPMLFDRAAIEQNKEGILTLSAQ